MTSFEERARVGSEKLKIQRQVEIEAFSKLPQEQKDQRLIEAVLGSYTPNVDIALEGGARVDARDPKTGMTALALAAQADLSLMAGHLIDKGADVNARDKKGRSVIEIAIRAAPDLIDPDPEDDKYYLAAKIARSPAFDTSTTIKWSGNGSQRPIGEYASIIGSALIQEALSERQEPAQGRPPTAGISAPKMK